MYRAATLACLVALGGCSDDGDATATLVQGSPAATRALLGAYVIGGDSAFGLARLMEHVGDRWVVSPEVPPFGAQARLYAGDVVHAASETTLYRLETSGWTPRAIPPASIAVTLIGVAGDEVYGVAPDPDGGALVRLPRATSIWEEVPGSRPIGLGARAFLVEPGRVTWSDPARGIVRVEGGAQTTLVDCTPEELGACTTPLTPLYDGADDALALVACSLDAPPSAAFRWRGGDLEPIELPPGLGSCAGVTRESGRAVLTTIASDAGDGLVLRLEGAAKAWQRIAVAMPGLTYVPDGHRIYGYGDGVNARGIYVLDP